MDSLSSKLVEVKLQALEIDSEANAFVMFLQEIRGNRILPIWIGKAEGYSIQIALQKLVPSRPLTHDLLKALLLAFNTKVEKVVINNLKESTYYARLILKQGKRLISIDSRPSDAVALAVRVNAPIFVVREVMDAAGIKPEKT